MAKKKKGNGKSAFIDDVFEYADEEIKAASEENLNARSKLKKTNVKKRVVKEDRLIEAEYRLMAGEELDVEDWRLEMEELLKLYPDEFDYLEEVLAPDSKIEKYTRGD